MWHKFAGRSESLDDYQIVSVQRGDIEDLVTATGTLQPRDYVDIGAQVSGQLKKIHVEVGSVVAAGSLLAEIDPTVYLANVDARRASLRNQQATLLDREAQLTLAGLQYKRQKNLLEGDATTIESVQAAEATLHSAEAQLQALQAQIEQTQSTLLADEANLNYAKIYAPIAGVVVSI
ncbi:MAG TPA: biotin/lipoyl-binding protein, partial [Spongiibacteraceae bacterium]|nr:biotin/lipoyl-binding protein [Spongiibacteraceae bacterium]